MSHVDIIRAWKDEDYRLSLSDAQRSQLPESPVGLIELSDLDMGLLAGGTGSSNPSCKSYKKAHKKPTGAMGKCQGNTSHRKSCVM